jgi:hypothetical protein
MTVTAREDATSYRQKFHLLGAALLLISIVFFTYRTVARPAAWQWDFAIYSAASRAWGAGQNPYDEQLLYIQWKQQGHELFHDISWLQSIVPPTTLALLYPFAALPRTVAFWSWYLFNCAALVAMILALRDICALSPSPATPSLTPSPGTPEEGRGEGLSLLSTQHSALSTFLLPAWILALGPIQSGISAGQPAIPAVALIVLAAWSATKNKDILAGILLGLTAGFKLQLAAPFLLYYLYITRWRIALTAAITFSLLATVAILRLNLAHVPWFSDWTANIQRAATTGGPNDFTTANRNRDHLVNLQVPLYALFTSRTIAHALAFLITGTLALIYAVKLRPILHVGATPASRSSLPPSLGTPGEGRPHLALRTQHSALTPLAPLAILTLLPIYHRYYDASLIVIPLALCLPRWRHRHAQIILALLLFFLLPVGWAVNLVRKNYLPTTITTSHFWNLGIMSLFPWLLLLMLIVLLLMLRAVILRVLPKDLATNTPTPDPSRIRSG